jgi:hypothetical protein
MRTLAVALLLYHDTLANVRRYSLPQRGDNCIPRNVYRDLCHRHSLIVLPYSLDYVSSEHSLGYSKIT